MHKRLFAALFLAAGFVWFANALSYCLGNNLFSDQTFIDNFELTMENAFLGKTVMREIYGTTNKVLSPDEIIYGSDVIVKNEEGFLEMIGMVTYDVTEAGNKICELQRVCKNAGAQFSYISYPSKTNSNTKREKFGINTNQESVREGFLNALETDGINVLNIRELMEAEGYTPKDIFYKTDHHWKTTAGLYGARAIADYLNDLFGYSLRADLLNENLFSYTTYENLWLGETGRRCSATWTGVLDDFIEIVPVYDTMIKVGFQYGEYNRSGDFRILIDDSGYNGNIDLYSYSAHYSYGVGFDSPVWIHNDNVVGKKILMIKDSFSAVVVPFLSLTTSDIAVWDMRVTPDGLYDYIAQNDFDIVLLAYTDFWEAGMYDFK